MRNGSSGTWVVRRSILQVRSSNLGVVEFYKKIGFIEDQVISMGKRL
jgi:hypothetical protein